MALSVILEQGYGGVSIEAIARGAGVTRPVVYDHFPNLDSLLRALIEREEHYSLQQLERIVPSDPEGQEPPELLLRGLRRYLEAITGRPATWRLILLPSDGTPAIVRAHVESNRARLLERITDLVRWATKRAGLPQDLDVELTARAIRDLSELAGRMVLTDPERYPPERYEDFVETVMALVWPR